MAILDDEYDVVLGNGSDAGADAILCRQEQTYDISTAFNSQWVAWVDEFNPLGGLELVTSDVPRMARAGTLVGADTPLIRRVSFDVHVVWGSGANDLTDFFNAWHTATGPISDTSEHMLRFTLAGSVWTMFGRYRVAEVADLRPIGQRYLRMTVRFEGTDPYIYGPESAAQTVPNNGTTVALDANGLPDVGSYVGPSTLSVTPTGTAPSRWRLDIRSKWANPVIWDTTSGEFLWFTDDTTDLFVSSDSDLLVGGGDRSATSVARNDYLQYLSGYSTWWRFDVGVARTIGFFPIVDGGGTLPSPAGGTCDLYTRTGYLGLGS